MRKVMTVRYICRISKLLLILITVIIVVDLIQLMLSAISRGT